MSAALNRRPLAYTIAAALLALALALVGFGLRPGSAGAQTVTGEDTEVFNDIAVHASNGNVNLGQGTGSNDGVLGASCAGQSPSSGPNIPGTVVTRLTATATVLRILHGNGTALTGNVTIVCTVDFGPITSPAAAAARTGAFQRR
jgi:hypothetical protein